MSTDVSELLRSSMTNYWAPSLFNFWAQAKTVSQTVLLSIIPSAWNVLFQALFSQRKVFVFSWFILKIEAHFYLLLESINLFYFKMVCLILKLTGKEWLAFLLVLVVLLEKWRCSEKGGHFLFANMGIHLWKTWFLVW